VSVSCYSQDDEGATTTFELPDAVTVKALEVEDEQEFVEKYVDFDFALRTSL